MPDISSLMGHHCALRLLMSHISIPRNGLMQILDRDECERRSMGLYLGVAAASARQPKFIHLTYSATEAHATCKQIALVGKGNSLPVMHAPCMCRWLPVTISGGGPAFLAGPDDCSGRVRQV